MEVEDVPIESWSFSQHWIIVNKLRVLVLDFVGEFSLLIPNIELGKAFRVNQANVELEIKEIEGGLQVTFIKFAFESPRMEIKAPVLSDRSVGFQVLQGNGACVFPSWIFTLSPQGPVTGPGHVPGLHRPQPGPVSDTQRMRED